jgi:hypothetical protein
MTTLIIVIVGENEGSVRTGHAQFIIDQVVQLSVLLYTQSDFGAVAKFSNVPFHHYKKEFYF